MDTVNDTISTKTMDTVNDTIIKWFDNGTHVCHDNNTLDEVDMWCGFKDSCTQKGLLLPLFQEVTWSKKARGFFYFVALIYSFLGVSIVSDRFCDSINKITTQTTKLYVAGFDKESYIEIKFWNDTVANLTLMALGSSAPEILLSLIELLGNNFKAGALGPGTIVGSAAFNFFAISAVIIAGLPTGEAKKIDKIIVSGVLSIFSVFAYVWLLIILKVISPNRVDLWEAIVTLFMFPLLVLIAYAADRELFNVLFCMPRPKKKDRQQQIGLAESYLLTERINTQKIVQEIKDLKMEHAERHVELTEEEITQFILHRLVDTLPKTRMHYRSDAIRGMTGSRRLKSSSKLVIDDKKDKTNTFSDDDEEMAIVEFYTASSSVRADVGLYKLSIFRHGKLSDRVRVKVSTVDSSAIKETDYEEINEILTFVPYENEKNIEIKINEKTAVDKQFFLRLEPVRGDKVVKDKKGAVKDCKVGKNSIMDITIVNVSLPGSLEFDKRAHVVKESIGTVYLTVERKNGADSDIEVKWRTIDRAAHDGKEYVGGEGSLEFKEGETKHSINLSIKNNMTQEHLDKNFEVELYESSPEGLLGADTTTAVTIIRDDEFNSMIQNIIEMKDAAVSKLSVDDITWGQQFKAAITVNGGDEGEPSTMDYIMHVLTLGFKLIFAIIPPIGIAGGWLCFFVSLGMIGIIVAIIGDLATIFGCLVGLQDQVTAITLVALGTSLPDTMASLNEARDQEHADNAIGNITGSNSVNVFLGLGLPWVIAAIYWQARNPCATYNSKDCGFEMPAKTLGFSVILYCILSIITLIFYCLRRKLTFFGKAELGGPKGPKYASAFFMVNLWVIYVFLSTIQVYGLIDPGF